MVDVGISYSHRDTTAAVALRAACIQAGLSVWMDDPGSGGEAAGDLGIPIGRAHWDVIEREFAEAIVIMALDTPSWRASDYCQREYQRCEELGKWIVHTSQDEAPSAALAAARQIEDQKPLLLAHARLAERVVAADSRATWLQRWFGQAIGADAQTLLSTDLARTGLSITEPIRKVAANDVRMAQQARRRLRTVSVTVVAVLATLAIGAGVAWGLASVFSAHALVSAKHAEAIALAAQSAKETDTLTAIAQARRAVALDPEGPGVAALAAAQVSDKRLRTLVLPPDQYVGGAWAAATPTVLAYTELSVTPVNADTGAVGKRVSVKNTIYPGLFVAGPDGKTAVYVDFNDRLNWLNLVTGASRLLGPVDITSIDLSNDGLLWWGSASATLSSAPYPADGALGEPTTTKLTTPAIAVDAVTTQVAYIGDDAEVHLLWRSGNVLTPGPSQQLHEAPNMPAGGYRSSISDCGGVLYGSYDQALVGTQFRWEPASGSFEQSGITRSSAPVCVNTAAWASDATRGVVQDPSKDLLLDLGADTDRYFAVSDPLHERFAQLSPAPARLFVLNPDTMEVVKDYTAPDSAQIVLENRVWIVGPDGQLFDASTGATGGRLPGTTAQGDSLAQYIASSGCDAIVPTNGQLFHIGCDGAVNALSVPFAGARDLRAGAYRDHFVLTKTSEVVLLHGGGEVADTIPLPWATSADWGQDADVSPDGSKLAVVDQLGQIHVVALSRPNNWTTLPIAVPAGENQISFTARGDIVVLASNRLVTLMTDKGRTIAVSATSAEDERMNVQGHDVILSSLSGAGVVLDDRTLAVLQNLSTGMFVEQANGTLRGIALYSSTTPTTASSAFTITLPAIR
jgi:hypothetical protein